MAIKELKCHEFRNLTNTSLNFNQHLNIVIGANGSGKTSLLEAIYILSTSKSFRTKYLKNCINNDFEEFILFSKYTDHIVGLKKDHQSLITKVNNKIVSKSSTLAKLQSVIIIDPSSFELINGSPQKKREFLDWGLFHVEHGFSKLWLNYKHVIKQRNQLLRTKQIKNISYWDKHLITFNDEIHQFRKLLVDELSSKFYQQVKTNEVLSKIKISYRQGWNKEFSYSEALKDKFNLDVKKGFTSVGTHKCDLLFTIDNKNIKEVLSRGQLKNFLIILYLINMQYVSEFKDIKPIFIIDDLASELDKNTFKDVIVSLIQKNYQIFISNIEYDEYLKQLNIDKTVFHVKHGEISVTQG